MASHVARFGKSRAYDFAIRATVPTKMENAAAVGNALSILTQDFTNA
jgi:hypothetical protein